MKRSLIALTMTLSLAVPSIALAAPPEDAAGDKANENAEDKADNAEDKAGNASDKGDAKRAVAVAKVEAKTKKAKPDGDAAEGPEKKTRILAALGLPAAAKKARKAGIPEKEVRAAIEGAKKKKKDAKLVLTVLDQGEKEAKAKGKVDNFGTVVQELLDSGLRGKALADAIHEAKGDAKAAKAAKKAAKKADKKADKAEDKAEKAEDKAEKADDKAEAKADKAQDKAEDKADKAEGKADKAEAKADKAEAKADKKSDKADAKADKKADKGAKGKGKK